MDDDAMLARIAQALDEVASAQAMTWEWRRLPYGPEDLVLFHHACAPPREIAAVLPIDRTLHTALMHPLASHSVRRRVLHDDLFADLPEPEEERDLCRIGMIGAHVLAQSPFYASVVPPRLTIAFEPACVSVSIGGSTGLSLRVPSDLVLLLRQFRRGERYARVYTAFRRQAEAAAPGV